MCLYMKRKNNASLVSQLVQYNEFTQQQYIIVVSYRVGTGIGHGQRPRSSVNNVKVFI